MIALLVNVLPALRQRATPILSTLACECRDVSVIDAPQNTRALRPRLVIIGMSGDDAPSVVPIVSTVRDIDPRVPILLVVSGGSEAVAVSAFRAGATDYFTEPLDGPAFAASVRCRLRDADPFTRADASAPPRRSASEVPLVGTSFAMRDIVEYLGRVAERDSTVLITGETGTGKELAASLIHERSRRRAARFVSVNCAAIPEALLESELFGHESGAFTGASGRRDGLLQAADHGTVFLDEVGDMGAQAQAKILRAIETREVYRLGAKHPQQLDIRVIAATNQDLERAVEDGRFRKDLYYRLNVARIHLPPLRARKSDIGALLDYYLRVLGRDRSSVIAGFASETRRALEAYDWPGNVRELKNLVEALFVAPPSEPVRIADLPENFRLRLCNGGNADAEKRRLLDALLEANWNKSRAASILHCSRMTLYRRMERHSVVSSAENTRRKA